MPTTTESLVEALYRVDGKAEVVNGEILRMSPSGALHGDASITICMSLRTYARKTKCGHAFGDNVGFLVDLPHRKSFCPDAAFHTGRHPGMKFVTGAPVLAIEIRSDGDYGRKAEANMARKRADYFAAGTLVVWDVDLLGKDIIRVYRAADPEHPAVYGRNQAAEAEPAVPGWRFPVNDLF